MSLGDAEVSVESREVDVEEAEPRAGDGGLSLYLRRLRVLTRSWGGELIGQDGLLRVLNPGGSRPPLFWCFNDQHEFDMMGAGLGPEQPVVGMRSLNTVAAPGPERRAAALRLADHYAQGLLEGMAFDRCALGGNCQSAPIATRIATRLLHAGKRVDLLLTLEGTPPMPYPGRVALLFGRESETHNPFLRGESPEALWRAIYGEVGWSIVPGGHGQYFTGENVGALCEAIGGRLGEAWKAQAPASVASGARLVLATRPAQAEAGAALDLRAAVRTMSLRVASYRVRPLWVSETQGLWTAPGGEPPPLVTSDRSIELKVATPDTPGPWRLHLFLCQDGVGPVAWREDSEAALEIELQCNAEAA